MAMLRLTGVGGPYITISKIPHYNITQSFTVEVWVHPGGAGEGIQNIVSRWGAPAAQAASWTLRLDGGRPDFEIYSNGTTILKAPAAIEGLHHIAAVFRYGSPHVMELWVDGVKVASQTTSNRPQAQSNYDIWFGAETNKTHSRYVGLLGEVRLWNYDRSPTEIAQNYNRELRGDEPGLIGYWKLNGDLLDSSVYQNHGVASGELEWGQPDPVPRSEDDSNGVRLYLLRVGNDIIAPAANLCVRGQAFANGYFNNAIPAYAFDGKVNTCWDGYDGKTVNGWAHIGYFFGIPRVVRYIRLNQSTGYGWVSALKVQQSQNGASWTDVATISGLTTEWNEFAVPEAPPAPYWRLLAASNTQGSGSGWLIWEVEMYAVEGAYEVVGTADKLSESLFRAYGAPSLIIPQGMTEATLLLLTNEGGESPTVEVAAVPRGTLVIPNGVLPLDRVAAVTGFEVTGSGNFRVIVSADGGSTWYTRTDQGWTIVDPGDTEEIAANGMTADTLADLSAETWAELTGDADPIRLRFAYYLDGDAQVDSLVGTFTMKGMWQAAVPGQDWRYSNLGNRILVRLLEDGDYKINY